MNLRNDHVTGGALIAAGLIVWALSADLPTGRLSMPGAGMMPKLLCVLIVFFGIALLLRAKESPLLSTVEWADIRHAGPVIAITAAAAALYSTLGFVITMTLLLFALLCFERRNLVAAAIYSIGISVATYALFTIVLKTPLDQGLLPI